MENTAAAFDMSYIDSIAPKHDRTSCADSNPEYNAQTAGESIGGHCYRCTLLHAVHSALKSAEEYKSKIARELADGDDQHPSEFEEGQWWVEELDNMVAYTISGGKVTGDQRRAVAVVHHLLRSVKIFGGTFAK